MQTQMTKSTELSAHKQLLAIWMEKRLKECKSTSGKPFPRNKETRKSKRRLSGTRTLRRDATSMLRISQLLSQKLTLEKCLKSLVKLKASRFYQRRVKHFTHLFASSSQTVQHLPSNNLKIRQLITRPCLSGTMSSKKWDRCNKRRLVIWLVSKIWENNRCQAKSPLTCSTSQRFTKSFRP
jgi:hypothetical protein